MGREPVEASKKVCTNEEKTLHENEDENIMDFGDMLAPFRKAFGTILGTKSQQKLSEDFGVHF